MKKRYFKFRLFRGFLVLSFAGLVSVTGAMPPQSQPTDTLRKQEAGSHYRYMALMSLGLLPGSHDVIGWVPVSMQFSQGFLHTSGVYTGITLGVETFEPDILPVVFDLRYYLPKGRSYPFLGVSGGYGVTLSHDYYGTRYPGGPYFGVSAGLNYEISAHNSWWFSVGYRYQAIRGKSEDYQGHTYIDLTQFNRLELRLGIRFR